MDGQAAARRYSVASVLTLPKGPSAVNPFLNQFTRNIKKLDETWARFKATPTDIAFLVRDLVSLSKFVAQTIQEFQFAPQISPVVEASLRSCAEKSQELLELSGKYTGRLARRPLTGDKLKNLRALLSDSKVRFLVTELLLERRSKPISHSALAEELAQLHARDLQTASGNLQVKRVEPRTDSLLSFKCYSELVGREDVLLNLEQKYESAGALALVGPDGGGKSQIAAEYALRFQNKNPDSQVFWVFCESPAAFEESYRAIATKLGIPGSDDSRADVLDRVRRHLCQERAGRWLLILENADNTEVLWGRDSNAQLESLSRPQVRLGTYLPSSSSGQTLCLSSEASVGASFPDPLIVLKVNPLLESEATTLFQSKLPKDLHISKISTALAGVLDCSPLAICLAAAYMVMMRHDTAHYLVSYKTEASTILTKGLGRVSGSGLNGKIAQTSSFKAWALSFDQIQQQNPQAANLFALMAMFHHRAIPKNLLYHAWKHGLVSGGVQRTIPDFDIELLPTPPDLVESQEKKTYLGFSMALATLEAFLFVQYDTSHETYSMHHTVQLSMWTYLQPREALRSWRSTALILLASACQPFRMPHKSHTRSRSNLILHVAKLLHQPHDGDVASLAKARILCDVGSWKYSLLQTKISTTLFQEAYEIQNKLLKPQDARTLRTLVSLGDSKTVSESPSAAIPLFIEAVSGLKHTLGPGNRRTIFAQLSLCANHVSCGNADAASTVHYEAQAATSASLQITPEDRKRVMSRLGELGSQINILLARQGRRSLSDSDLKKTKSRVNALKHGSLHRLRGSKAFSSQSRVSSLDSIVELLEVEASRT